MRSQHLRYDEERKIDGCFLSSIMCGLLAFGVQLP